MPHTQSIFKNALPWVFAFALILIAIPLWAAAPRMAGGATEVIADSATKTVRIIVDGKEIAVFDGKGLHVQGDVGLTGQFHPGIYSGPVPDLTDSPTRAP